MTIFDLITAPIKSSTLHLKKSWTQKIILRREEIERERLWEWVLGFTNERFSEYKGGLGVWKTLILCQMCRQILDFEDVKFGPTYVLKLGYEKIAQ